jgi:hypothetical protein
MPGPITQGETKHLTSGIPSADSGHMNRLDHGRVRTPDQPPMGGLLPQKGVLACPGDLKIAGLAELFLGLAPLLPVRARRAVRGQRPHR